MMNVVSCLWMLTMFHVLIRTLGCLKSENYEELIYMCIECLAISLCIQLVQSISRAIQIVKTRGCVDLGDTYYSMGDYSKAMKYYQTSLDICELTGSKEGQEMAYRGLGNVILKIGEHDNSIRYLHKALNIAQEIEGRQGKQRMAAVYCSLGDVYLATSELDKAKECYQQQLEIALEIRDKNLQGVAYLNIGRLCISRCEYNEAIKNLDKGVEIVKRLGEKNNEAVGYLNLGDTYYSMGDYSNAMKYYQTSLDICELTGSKEGQAMAYRGLGNVNLKIGEHDNSIRYLHKAFNIAQEIEGRQGKQHMAAVYCSLGNAYLTMSELDKAMEHYQQLLEIALEIRDKNLQGVAYLNIGRLCISRCEYNEAIKNLDKGVEIAKQLGNKNNEAVGYRNLGETYSLFDYSKAMKYYQTSLDICESTGYKEGQEMAYRGLGAASLCIGEYYNSIRYLHKSLDIATNIENGEGKTKSDNPSLIILGCVYLILGRSREAIPYFQKSLEFAGTIIKDRQSQILTLFRVGMAYSLIGNTQKAMEFHKEQLKLSKEIEFKMGELLALYGFAFISFSKREYSEAITYFEKMLEITVNINENAFQAAGFFFVGVCHLFLNNCEQAISCFEESLTIGKEMEYRPVEHVDNSFLALTYFQLTLSDNDLISKKENYKKSEVHARKAIEGSDLMLHHLHNQDDLKISFFKTFFCKYNVLIEVLIETQRIEEALLVAERGRGRSLTDLLISKYFISRPVAVAIASPFSNYDEVPVFLSRNKLCILFYTMAFRYIISVLVQNKPVFYHIQGSLTWESFVSPRRKDGGDFFGIECEYEAYIEKLVDEAYDKMGVTAATTNVPEDNRDPLEKLFDVIIAPVQSRVTREDIVIIPQGPLYLVPFPALRDPKTGLFLIETHRIRLAPSLSALKTWQECPADYHSAEGALVIGNPTLGKVMLRGEERILDSLPIAQDEAEYIAGRLGVTALIGSQATKEEVKSRLAKGVAVIHIAAHSDPQRGEIALAPSESAIQKGVPEEEDYMLTMREVQQIGIRAKLVVLSCCHSGRGDIEPEGVVGMSRAFLAAGARAVIASLWPVEDNVTYHFMMKLYIELGKGHSASASLQQTMKYMRSQLGYTDPKDWAPFYLIGDDVTIT